MDFAMAGTATYIIDLLKEKQNMKNNRLRFDVSQLCIINLGQQLHNGIKKEPTSTKQNLNHLMLYL